MKYRLKSESFFYKLLMSGDIAYRIGRHALFMLALLFVAYNQVQMCFWGKESLLGNHYYLLVAGFMVRYLIEAYLNVYVWIPRLFLKKKYALYFFVFSAVVLFFVVAHYLLEFFLLVYYDLSPGMFSYTQKQGVRFALEIASSYFVDYIAILGVGLTKILKYWLTNDRKVYLLEKVHIQTLVDHLKEQISPQLLFSVLHKIGDLTSESQERASDLLLELSNLLRYQLYDCNRKEVLLHAEIKFISNYLEVEKLCDERMDYEIKTIGNLHRILLPPMLFFPFVQEAVTGFKKEDKPSMIHLSFQAEENRLLFYCDCCDEHLLASAELKNTLQRLSGLYGEKYDLNIKPVTNCSGDRLCLCISI